MTQSSKRDTVCLILEGTYPYVPGGVSTWTHELIEAQSNTDFHIVALLPPDGKAELKYELPKNVISIKNIFLQKLPRGAKALRPRAEKKLFESLEAPLLGMQTKADIKTLKAILDILSRHRKKLGEDILLNSEASWQMLLRMYNMTLGDSAFLDYFWSYRALLGGLYSVLLADLPKADVYHALCTGYAGLMLARAKLETGKPCFVTEHGIYTNERHIEIASADWLHNQEAFSLSLKKSLYKKELWDFWMDSFSAYSKLCYEASTYIVTLYEGNQPFQVRDGADPDKLKVIPNGINYERYAAVKKDKKHPPTVALIGRVVPIKDVKTLIRAAAILSKKVPDVKIYILGPTEEDENYFKECKAIVKYEKLENIVEFTGRVKIDDYMPKIDVQVLTSISEAQPLVILEVGAAGIPTVATNVGACSEMILGGTNEEPKLGPAGVVCSLSNPNDIAQGICKLLTDKEFYNQCSTTINKRVEKYYNKKDQHKTYKALYAELVKQSRKKEVA